MEQLIAFLKEAIANLLALLGIEVDDKFVENVEVAVKDVIDFGNEAAK